MNRDSLNKQITVVILAGGRGRRMRQQDKGLVVLDKRPLIEHVLEAVSPQNPNILINANQNLEQYQQYGYRVISDEMADFQGPLAGVATAMGQVETPYILTLPCDAPFVEHNYQQKMWSALETQQTDLAVAYDGKRLQPVHALIPIHLHADLLKFLSGDTRRVDSWYSQYAMGLVDFSKQVRMFCNLNTPEELEAYSLEKKSII